MAWPIENLDEKGRVTGQVDTTGTAAQRWANNYDANDQLTGRTYQTSNGNPDPSATGEQYQYDASGNRAGGTTSDLDVLRQAIQAGDFTLVGGETERTAMLNLVSTANQTGPENRLQHDGKYLYAYDANGNLLGKASYDVIYPDIRTYPGPPPNSPSSNLSSHIEPRIGANPSSESTNTHYTWDYRNRLTEVTKDIFDGDHSQPTSTAMRYTYDVDNNRIGEERVWPQNDTVTRTAEGEVRDASSAGGSALTLTFDDAGDVASRILHTPDGTALAEERNANAGTVVQGAGRVTPDIHSSAIRFFGGSSSVTFPAGSYRVAYKSGAMQFQSGFDWSLQYYTRQFGFRVAQGATASANDVAAPGSGLGYPTSEQLRQSELGSRVVLDQTTAGPIGVYLNDGDGYGNTVHGDNGDPTFSLIRMDGRGGAGKTNWLLTDQIGSVKETIDNSANVVNNWTYDSFGNMTSTTVPQVNGSQPPVSHFGYAGMEQDDPAVGTAGAREITGNPFAGMGQLMHDGARTYDTATGKFLSEDPAGADGNLYRYVGNNVPNAVDPTGMYAAAASSHNFNIDSSSGYVGNSFSFGTNTSSPSSFSDLGAMQSESGLNSPGVTLAGSGLPSPSNSGPSLIGQWYNIDKNAAGTMWQRIKDAASGNPLLIAPRIDAAVFNTMGEADAQIGDLLSGRGNVGLGTVANIGGRVAHLLGGVADPVDGVAALGAASGDVAARATTSSGSATWGTLAGTLYGAGSMVGLTQISEGGFNINYQTGDSIGNGMQRWGQIAGGVSALTLTAAGAASYFGGGSGVSLDAAESSVTTTPYGNLSRNLPDGFQANHLNQNAAFNSVIPEDQGLAVGMRGNAFTDIGSPHYEFHASLEEFWSPYRNRGSLFQQVPTNAQYGTALQQALVRSGYTPAQAANIAEQAAAQRAAFGLNPSVPVPRVPGRIPQAKP